MFFSFDDLCDVVSVLPYCPEEDRFLIANDERNPGYWIPSKKSLFGNQWKCTAKELLEEHSIDGEINNMCKLVRVWKPLGKGEIHHVVFSALISKCSKRKDTPNQKIKLFWASTEEIQQSYSRLRSPELLDFMSVLKSKCLQRPEQIKESMNPEGSWTKLIDDCSLNLVVEILERHIFPDIKFTAHQRLLDSAHFSRRIQIGLFAHFLVRCFPCSYMNMALFSKVVLELGWDGKAVTRLFHTADVNSMGYLSYRDFLYFMAVMEPKANGDSSGEIRTRYLFRYYDHNNDNILDHAELKHIVDDVLKVKRKIPFKSQIDVCPIMFAGGPDFASNMKTFLDLVGNLKLRGTSMLLRSASSIADVFPPLTEDIKFVKFVPEPSPVYGALATRLVTFFPRNAESLLNILSRDRIELRRNYEVEIHCAKLTEDGTVVDINKLNLGSSHSVSPSYNRDGVFGKLFRNIYSAAQVEILKSIKFFTREISGKEALAKFMKGPKQSFSWGPVDPSTIVPSLLKICEGVTLILREEPRLIELKPPVCALGDLHGSFSDLLLFEKAFWNLGPTLSPTSLLFLGDYVDRGPHGVEVIAYLFAHKLESPHKITLLRGSHEIRVVQQTFYSECTEKFGETLGRDVWHAVNTAMDCLPLAAVVGGRVFCSHGGIPPPWLCPVVSAINSIPCPLPKPDEQSPLAWELMWNEPLKKSDVTDALEVELEAKEGFAVNPVKGTGHLFNASALEKFLLANGLSLLLRAHEMQDIEYSEELRQMMLTLHSATMNKGKRDDSTCVLVYLGKDHKKEGDLP